MTTIFISSPISKNTTKVLPSWQKIMVLNLYAGIQMEIPKGTSITKKLKQPFLSTCLHSQKVIYGEIMTLKNSRTVKWDCVVGISQQNIFDSYSKIACWEGRGSNITEKQPDFQIDFHGFDNVLIWNNHHVYQKRNLEKLPSFDHPVINKILKGVYEFM
jgi:hypothetical protein